MVEGRKRVLVTRATGQASALADALRVRGLEPVVVPVIEIQPLEDYGDLDSALAWLGEFDWLVFSSANAVTVFRERAGSRDLPRVAVIGKATAVAAREAGMRVDLVPPTAVAESLAEALIEADGGQRGTVLLVRAQDGRDVLPELLQAAGMQATVAPAYRNVRPDGAAAELARELGQDGHAVGAVTFTSASSVRNLFELLSEAGLALPPQALRVSIGPVTSASLRARGERVDAEAPTASVESLAEVTLLALSLKEIM